MGSKAAAERFQAHKRKLRRRLMRKRPGTYEHTKGIVFWAERIAGELAKQGNPIDPKMARDTAWLHDIGKLKISQELLNSKHITKGERQELQRRHVLEAFSFLVEYCPKEVVEGVMSHHERFDGEGYPLGLQGYKIPLMGRIIKAADEFQTKIEPRSFSKKMRSHAQALSEMRRGKGHSFDPEIVEALAEVLIRMKMV